MGLIGLDFSTHITQGERQKKQIMAIVCAGTRRVMHVTKRVWGYCSGHAPMKQSIQAHVWDMGGLPAPDIGRHAHGEIMLTKQNHIKQSKKTHTKKKNITAKARNTNRLSLPVLHAKKNKRQKEKSLRRHQQQRSKHACTTNTTTK